ncbi:MAG: MBL fold metallo-hydrolase [Planctomycetes bacterium]|nr:MBL fold metallo-hydrolase [Planctomycetota bacterium]
MKRELLFDDGDRRWVYFGRDPERPDTLIDTNEYLVIHGDKAMLPDPGGIEIFPQVAAEVSGEVAIENIEVLFASHQDPDIISSLFLWIGVCPGVRVLAPWTWTLFIPHFGSARPVTGIPDEGMTIELGKSSDIRAIPAHYVHASGMFTLYDPRAKILFSADIGAALLPETETDVFVKDFDRHVGYMEAFHRRWMPSNRAKNAWIDRVKDLDIEMMCPQHGSIFKGKDVERFLGWFQDLEVGNAV